jgi:adenosylcobinamide-GDP ribazoletransferase
MNGAPRLRWWMPFLLAVQFLTRLPVPGLSNITADIAKQGLTKSVIWFPAVGAIVGFMTAVVLITADYIWPRAIAVIIALIFEARLTGAFHEDAVADFCDGFGGGMTPERIHEIMKDSRIGTYGALGLGLAVGLRAALLILLPDSLLLPALIASACFGRYIAVCLMASVVPMKQTSGLAKDIGAQTQMEQWAAASVLTVPFVVPLFMTAPMQALAALAASGLFIIWFRRFLMRHLGGVTGDCLGFGVYAGQIIMLLAAAAHLA